jgi:hypothetical protein
MEFSPTLDGAAGGGGGRHPSKFEERHTWKIEEDTYEEIEIRGAEGQT